MSSSSTVILHYTLYLWPISRLLFQTVNGPPLSIFSHYISKSRPFQELLSFSKDAEKHLQIPHKITQGKKKKKSPTSN